jgi:hypothetical protein
MVRIKARTKKKGRVSKGRRKAKSEALTPTLNLQRAGLPDPPSPTTTQVHTQPHRTRMRQRQREEFQREEKKKCSSNTHAEPSTGRSARPPS